MNRSLAVQNRHQYVTRDYTDPSGRSFRLTFVVGILNGELKARLVSVEQIRGQESGRLMIRGHCRNHVSSDVLCLPVIFDQDHNCPEVTVNGISTKSPYFSFMDFLITSQPPRAPSFF